MFDVSNKDDFFNLYLSSEEKLKRIEKEKDSIDWPKIAENRKHKFYFVGCYFGNLYMYDKTKKKMILYIEK